MASCTVAEPRAAEGVDDLRVGAFDVAMDDAEFMHDGLLAWNGTRIEPLAARVQLRIEPRKDAARIAFVDLRALVGTQRGGLDVAPRVVVEVAGLGIDAAHGADHLGGEQDVLGRDHAREQVDARLVVDAGVEEQVLQQSNT